MPSFKRAANRDGSSRHACLKSSTASVGRPRLISATPRLFDRIAVVLSAPGAAPPGRRREHAARSMAARQTVTTNRVSFTALPESLPRCRRKRLKDGQSVRWASAPQPGLPLRPCQAQT